MTPHRRSVLDQLTGRRLPGGCDDCAAFQTVITQGQGLYVLTVHHDASCPAYQAEIDAHNDRTNP
jgi:hypothetical protein